MKLGDLRLSPLLKALNRTFSSYLQYKLKRDVSVNF